MFKKYRFLIVGLFAFFIYGLLYGWYRIPPFNTGWVLSQNNDYFVYWFGWKAYSFSNWSWPITHFDGLLYPVGINTINCDIIPWLAILFKTIQSGVSSSIQYFGLWHFGSLLLLGYFGMKILDLLESSYGSSFLGALLILINYPLYERKIHITLTGQWIILASFYVFLLAQNRKINFSKMLVFSNLLNIFVLGVHAYFWAMIFPILFLANFVFWKGKERIFNMISLVVTSGLAWIMLGYNQLESLGDAGFFLYHADLFSLLNPTQNSRFFESFGQGDGAYEGSAYLGSGIILLICVILALSIIQFFKLKTNQQNKEPKDCDNLNFHFSFWILLILFFIFSLGSEVEFMGHKIITLSFYDSLEPIPSAFRSAGRFIWPLFYGLIIWSIYYSGRLLNNKKNHFILLSVVLIIQILEFDPIYEGIDNLKANLNFVDPSEGQWDYEKLNLFRPELNNFLQENNNQIQAILVYPDDQVQNKAFLPLILYASTFNKKIQLFDYMARAPKNKILNIKLEIKKWVEEGISPHWLQSGSLVVLPNQMNTELLMRNGTWKCTQESDSIVKLCLFST